MIEIIFLRKTKKMPRPSYAGQMLIESRKKSKQLIAENDSRLEGLPIEIQVDVSFPKVIRRHGEIDWFENVNKVFQAQTTKTHKVYNDLLISNKPSWLLVKREELSDSPWYEVKDFQANDKRIKLWKNTTPCVNFKPYEEDIIYRNKNLDLILKRFELEESLICDNEDIEKLVRLQFIQNNVLTQIHEDLKNGNASPQAMEVVNHYEQHMSSSGNLQINMPVSIGFTIPLSSSRR